MYPYGFKFRHNQGAKVTVHRNVNIEIRGYFWNKIQRIDISNISR